MIVPSSGTSSMNGSSDEAALLVRTFQQQVHNYGIVTKKDNQQIGNKEDDSGIAGRAEVWRE